MDFMKAIYVVDTEIADGKIDDYGKRAWSTILPKILELGTDTQQLKAEICDNPCKYSNCHSSEQYSSYRFCPDCGCKLSAV